MDPMAQAFAYYTFDDAQGRMVYTGGNVQEKYFHNDTTFAFGFRTPDDAWENRWRKGHNALLGWDPALPGSGNGAKSLGQEFGASDAFASCQVEKVFRTVCLRNPQDQADRDEITTMAGSFRASGYKLKQAFTDTETFFKPKKPDATLWAAEARKHVETIQTAVAAGKWDEAKTTAGTLQQSCGRCHGQYRERFDDGSFRYKPGN